MARKKIGLALSGGGARGFSHVGVLRVLAENNVPIDYVAGTSAGSIVGGALASGMTIDEIETLAAKIGYANVMLPSLMFGGLFSNEPLGRFLRRHFPVTKIEEMPIPYAAVAFDLGKSEKRVFQDSGSLITAIRASCAVPGVFAPVRSEDGRMLVDGGVLSPMPTDVVRDMGADVVVAVDLLACGTTYTANSWTSIGITLQAAMATLRLASKNEHVNADIVIEPRIAHLRMDQMGKRNEFIELGAEAARQKIGQIKKLAGI